VPLLGTERGAEEVGLGAGGDRTVVLDRVAEAVVLDGLAALAARGERFSVLSEEVGWVDHGAPQPLVLVDPVDGSLNAKQGVPAAAVMLSLLRGPRLGDATAAQVLNLATGESWQVRRGGGLTHDGRPVRPLPAGPGGIELLGLESTPQSVLSVEPLLRSCAKIRLLGTMAISLAHTASGGLSVFCSPIQARAFDMSAGVLMLAEVGGVTTDLEGRPTAELVADLGVRSTLLASAHPGLHRLALDLLQS